LYWARGRVEGGFEAPVPLVDAPVEQLYAAVSNQPAVRVWVGVRAPTPREATELWRLGAGAAPVRDGRWPLPCRVQDLAPAPGAAADALLLLCPDGLWAKSAPEQDDPPTRVLDLAGARRFVRVGAELAVVTEGGLVRLQRSADGAWSTGPAEGPEGITAAAVLGSGRRLAVAQEALWTWREGEPPSPFGAAGGAGVEGLLPAGPEAWLWLSGIEGAGSSGVARLADPWMLTAAAVLQVRRPTEESWPAQLTVP